MNSNFDQVYFESSDKNKSNVNISWLNEIILEDEFPKFLEELNEKTTIQPHQHQITQEVSTAQNNHRTQEASFDPFELETTKQEQYSSPLLQCQSVDFQEGILSLMDKPKNQKSKESDTKTKSKTNSKKQNQKQKEKINDKQINQEDSIRESSAELSDSSVPKKSNISNKQFNSEEERQKYLKRRINNNLAAKNSRRKKQEREEENTHYLQQLLMENKQLKEDLLKYQTEALVTRQTLNMIIQSVARTNPNFVLPINPYFSQTFPQNPNPNFPQ